MQKVKEKIKEINEESQTNETSAINYNNLKPEINSLLMTYLPKEITINDADTLAIVIVDMIQNPQNYLEKPYQMLNYK